MNTKNFLIVGGIILVVLYFASNGNSSGEKIGRGGSAYTGPSALDNQIKKLSNEKNFSIILYDMDYDEAKKQYSHQYKTIIERTTPVDTVVSELADWQPVEELFFKKHIDNMGMEIASKKDGKVNKTASPPGYSNYVGNEKYGRWERRDGGSFWSFYGRYAFMSHMFGMAMMPVRMSYWNDYHNNYYRHGRAYYGSGVGGGRLYGTNSRYMSSTGTSTRWSSKPASFRQNVRSRVAQSKSATSRSRYSKRSSRSSGRYKSSSSSFRSRGGSFGK